MGCLGLTPFVIPAFRINLVGDKPFKRWNRERDGGTDRLVSKTHPAVGLAIDVQVESDESFVVGSLDAFDVDSVETGNVCKCSMFFFTSSMKLR